MGTINTNCSKFRRGPQKSQNSDGAVEILDFVGYVVPPAGWRKPNLPIRGFSGTLGSLWGGKEGTDQRLDWMVLEVFSHLSNSRICRMWSSSLGCVYLSKSHFFLLRSHPIKERPGELQESKLLEQIVKPLNHFPPSLSQFFPSPHLFSLAGAAGRASPAPAGTISFTLAPVRTISKAGELNLRSELKIHCSQLGFCPLCRAQ